MAKLNNTGTPPAARTTITLPAAAQTAAAGTSNAGGLSLTLPTAQSGHTFALGSVGGAAPGLAQRRRRQQQLSLLKTRTEDTIFTDDSASGSSLRPALHAISQPNISYEVLIDIALKQVEIREGMADKVDQDIVRLVIQHGRNNIAPLYNAINALRNEYIADHPQD